jgi:DNA-binding phage protein
MGRTKILKIKISLEQSSTGQIFRRDEMPTDKSYHSYSIESLQDPTEAAAYLNTVLEDGNLEHILLALRNVAEARRNLIDATDTTNEPDCDWKNCYQLLVQEKTPDFLLIAKLLNELGLRPSVTIKNIAA